MDYAIEILEEQKQLLGSELENTKGVEFLETRQKFREVNDALNKLILPNVSNRRELLHKLLQNLSDNNELFTDETHDDIIDRIMQ